MKKKPKRWGKYGYVEFVDKCKLKYDGYDDNIEHEIRKPTPAEREEIILNYIRANSGKSVEVWWLAPAVLFNTHFANRWFVNRPCENIYLFTID